MREGSAASVHPAVAGSAVRQQRASLLSQLTRYGDIEEPEQIDDIAYVTPDMLDGMSVLILHSRTSVVLCYLVVAVKLGLRIAPVHKTARAIMLCAKQILVLKTETCSTPTQMICASRFTKHYSSHWSVCQIGNF